MKKKVVAVIFGGHSPEYHVSLSSAYSVISAIDCDKYEIIKIGITIDGKHWHRYDGAIDKIKDDTWHIDDNLLCQTILSPERGKGLIFFEKDEYKYQNIDIVFPVMHGRYGEDGTIQGLCELAGVPVVGCGSAASALCMDKVRSHHLVSLAGIKVSKAISFTKMPKDDELLDAVKTLALPVFVKPVKAGSSIGVKKLFSYNDISGAVADAFEYDDVVIIEENIAGKEVGCAVIGNEELTTGRVNEVEVAADSFFSYEEKYTLKSSTIHMPARISEEDELKIQEAAKTIFRTLGCRGYARFDMFIEDDGSVVFNEANSIPGFTEHSQLPKMMQASGMSYERLVDMLINLGLEQRKGVWYG